MKIDNDKLLAAQGMTFDTTRDAIFYARSLLEYLKTHNKNYTKEQYHRIEALYDILDCTKEWADEAGYYNDAGRL